MLNENLLLMPLLICAVSQFVLITNPLKTEFILYDIKVQFIPHRKHDSATKSNRLMLFREIVAVYCKNHTEYCVGKMQVFSMLKQAVHIVTTGI
jgi:hypothetical protein